MGGFCTSLAGEAVNWDEWMPVPMNILVVGECGDGKSTLISNLRDPLVAPKPLCGKSPGGVTKEIKSYRCHNVCGEQLNLIDTPGVGDDTITPMALIKLLEDFMSSNQIRGGIRGVVVTAPVPNCRIKLGAKIVQLIVDKGFVAAANGDRYASIILAGTKTDIADEEDKKNFLHGEGGGKSVVEVFFQHAQTPGKGLAVMLSKLDYSPLLGAIRRLPQTRISYQAPASGVMASAVAEKLGVEAADEREAEKVEREAEENAAQIRELQQRQRKAEERRQREQRELQEREDRMERDMEKERQRQERLERKEEDRMRRLLEREERERREEDARMQREHEAELRRRQKEDARRQRELEAQMREEEARRQREREEPETIRREELNTRLDQNLKNCHAGKVPLAFHVYGDAEVAFSFGKQNYKRGGASWHFTSDLDEMWKWIKEKDNKMVKTIASDGNWVICFMDENCGGSQSWAWGSLDHVKESIKEGWDDGKMITSVTNGKNGAWWVFLTEGGSAPFPPQSGSQGWETANTYSEINDYITKGYKDDKVVTDLCYNPVKEQYFCVMTGSEKGQRRISGPTDGSFPKADVKKGWSDDMQITTLLFDQKHNRWRVLMTSDVCELNTWAACDSFE